MSIAQQVYRDLENVRSKAPLVHNITNYVVMNNTANALLAAGASPVMAHAPEEVKEMTAIASALVVNIGTLSREWITGMKYAMSEAKEQGIPVVLDPVGVGATAYRNNTADELLSDYHPDIVRGNASEILALAKKAGETKGVDALHDSSDALEAGKKLAKQFNCAVVISGATDYVIDENKSFQIEDGHPLMSRVTGMGCTASALTGAFAAINNNYVEASRHAMVTMGISGELAAEKSDGPGSMQLQFLDALYQLNLKQLKNQLEKSE